MQHQSRKTFSGPIGRPRRVNADRHACGKIKLASRIPEETPEQAMATALKARIRVHGATKDNADSGLWGTVVGRLVIATVLDAKLIPIAQRYGRMKTLAGVLDDVRPAYGVPVIARLSCTFGRDPYDRMDPDKAWDDTDLRKRQAIIARIRQDHQDVTAALWEMQCRPETAGAGYVLDRAVCWDDAEVASGGHGQALLRAALSRLERLWTMQKNT